MKKAYAIVSPAFTLSGNMLRDLAFLIVIPFHWINFGHICGYSLEKKIDFYEDLDAAKKNFQTGDPKIMEQKAIIELELNDADEVVAFCKIHTPEKRARVGFFSSIWAEKSISKADASAYACNVINMLYQISKDEQLEIVGTQAQTK